jgi:hypothetical protein
MRYIHFFFFCQAVVNNSGTVSQVATAPFCILCTVMNLYITALWDMTTCSLVELQLIVKLSRASRYFMHHKV